mgnify:CR=1 FL=1
MTGPEVREERGEAGASAGDAGQHPGPCRHGREDGAHPLPAYRRGRGLQLPGRGRFRKAIIERSDAA